MPVSKTVCIAVIVVVVVCLVFIGVMVGVSLQKLNSDEGKNNGFACSTDTMCYHRYFCQKKCLNVCFVPAIKFYHDKGGKFLFSFVAGE
jgi:Fe-S-cluster-containing hydrogenase component 2